MQSWGAWLTSRSAVVRSSVVSTLSLSLYPAAFNCFLTPDARRALQSLQRQKSTGVVATLRCWQLHLLLCVPSAAALTAGSQRWPQR